MDEKKVTVGLVIPRSVKDSDSPFCELEKFTTDTKPDVFLFPEDHIYSENIDVLRNISERKTKVDHLWNGRPGMQEKKNSSMRLLSIHMVRSSGITAKHLSLTMNSQKDSAMVMLFRW